MQVCSYAAVFFIFVSAAAAEGSPSEPAAIIGDYVAVSRAQKNRLQGASMEVDIQAEVPKLHKSGRLHALRRISTLGRITYDALRFEGDRSIKNDVIARYLTAEAEAFKSEPDIAVTPANYKFKYKGPIVSDGRKVHAFHVSPRKKKLGMYVGELWIDPETHLPVREFGRLAKIPSIFLRKIEFVKDYAVQGGIAIPSRIQTSVQTRIVGTANLSIAVSSVSLAEGIQTGPTADSE